jgi:hypothetical protein
MVHCACNLIFNNVNYIIYYNNNFNDIQTPVTNIKNNLKYWYNAVYLCLRTSFFPPFMLDLFACLIINQNTMKLAYKTLNINRKY